MNTELKKQNAKNMLTGLKSIDNLIGGLNTGDVTIITGEVSVGKTALSLNIAVNAAKNNNYVAIASFEMLPEAVARRMIMSEVENVNHEVFNNQIATDNEIIEVARASKEIEKLPISFIDNCAFTLGQLKTDCTRLKDNNNLDLLVIDYIQLMNTKDEEEGQYITNALKELKEFAKNLNIHVIVVSQLGSKREECNPLDSAFIKYLNITQNVDNILLLNRQAINGLLVCDVIKSHNKEIKKLFLKHNNDFTKITDYENAPLNQF